MKKTKRGQAALEFLTTYGWVILVVLIAIGALLYFGFLNPEKLTGEKCVLSVGSGLFCEDFSAGEGTVTLRIANGAGETIYVNEVNVEGRGVEELDCMAWTGTKYIAADSKADFTVRCASVKEGDKVNAIVSLKYEGESELPKATSGELLVLAGGEIPGGPGGPGPQGSGMYCEFSPLQVSDNPSGGVHRALVKVMNEDGSPAEHGLLIHFSVTGSNSYSAIRKTGVGPPGDINTYAYFAYEDLYPTLTQTLFELPEKYEDHILACHYDITLNQDAFCCTADKVWTREAGSGYINCLLEPEEDSNVVYGVHKVKATVTKDGVPLEYARLKFVVDGVSGIDDTDRCPDWPPAPVNEDVCPYRDFGVYPIQKTSGEGIYYFVYKNKGFVGDDNIKAWGIYPMLHTALDTYTGNKFFCNSVTKTWTDPPVKCEITPAEKTIKLNPDGSPVPHSFTVHVTQNNGQAVSGILVDIAINGAPRCDQLSADQYGPTDENGDVTYTYFNTQEGTDEIVASGQVNDIDFKCSATAKWINPWVDCVMTPLSDTNPIDDKSHIVTALVFIPQSTDEQINPPTGISGVDVYFTVEALYSNNPNDELTASGTVTTGADGRAVFTYPNNFDDIMANVPGYEQVPGYDLIVAQGSSEGRTFQCKAVKIWTYPMARCTLDPLKYINPVGTQHTVKAYVERCDNTQDTQNCYDAWENVPVTFYIVKQDGTISQQTTVNTDGSGVATLEYTSGSQGVDSIYATGTLKRTDVPVSDEYSYPFFCSAIKEWV